MSQKWQKGQVVALLNQRLFNFNGITSQSTDGSEASSSSGEPWKLVIDCHHCANMWQVIKFSGHSPPSGECEPLSSGLGGVSRPTEDGDWAEREREGAETRVGRSEEQGPGAESLTLPGPGNACHIESLRGLGLSASLFRAKGISRISPGVKRERRNTLTTSRSITSCRYPWHGSFTV